MKNILGICICVFLLAAAACTGEAVPTETPPVETAPPPSIPTTPIPASLETVPPGYTSYSSQGWLMTSWILSPLRSEPAEPLAGKQVEVWANIYISDIPMSYIKAELMVNGKLADSKQLVFWYDDPQDFSLNFTPDSPGVYDIVVRANMLENEAYSLISGEDLSLYSCMKLNVA
jgi:hypothetical protein